MLISLSLSIITSRGGVARGNGSYVNYFVNVNCDQPGRGGY